MELLERAAEAASPLLRVEQALAAGGPELAGLLLTFDVGRIFLASDLSGKQVREQQVVSREDFPGALEIADEEDPWWRILGNPLTRVRGLQVGNGSGIALQFRTDGDNPRLVAILPGKRGLQVKLQGSAPA